MCDIYKNLPNPTPHVRRSNQDLFMQISHLPTYTHTHTQVCFRQRCSEYESALAEIREQCASVTRERGELVECVERVERERGEEREQLMAEIERLKTTLRNTEVRGEGNSANPCILCLHFPTN